MRSGTQSIERAIRLLKAVAERRDIGWRPTDLARHCEMEKTTTHRILRSLANGRLLRQRAGDRRYIPGPLLFELASAVPAYMTFRDLLHVELIALARRYRCIALLHLKSGMESVCVDTSGTSSVHPLTVIGTRRPITESTAGVAMLLAMSPSDCEDVLGRVYKDERFSPATKRARIYRRILEQSREAGFAYSEGDVIPGLGAIAIALPGSHERPRIAVSLMGPLTQIAGERLSRTASALQKEARRIGKEYANQIEDLGSELEDD